MDSDPRGTGDSLILLSPSLSGPTSHQRTSGVNRTRNGERLLNTKKSAKNLP